MQIVIDVPEETYQDVLKNGFIYDEDNEVVTHAIKNGTPHENVTEFADRCRECGRERVLDKIMTEIRNIEYLSCPQPYVVLNDVLQIIGKYKVEIEVQDADSN